MADHKAMIREMFTVIFKDITPDAKLVKRLADFRMGFINKNEDHMEFFGGNLTGAHVVRWVPKDRERFFTDVLQVDEMEIKDALLEVPAVKAERLVSSDALNQTCCFLLHWFYKSDLPEKLKRQAMLDAALIMHFRWLTSIMVRDYKYPVAPEVAMAVYANLTYKFAIKQYGSWYAVLHARCEDMIAEKALHMFTIANYEDDEKVIYLINDSQGRIRDMMKNLYRELEKVLIQGSRVRTNSDLINLDNEQIFKDKTRSLTIYLRYINSIVGDKNSFIKQDILDVIEKGVHTAPPKLVVQVLEWCSINHRYTGSKEVEDLVDAVLIHSFEYLAQHRTVYNSTTDLVSLVTSLKGVYMASRMSDPEVINIRERAEKIVKKATTTANTSVISAVRTALMLYIVLRAFTMNYYSGAQ